MSVERVQVTAAVARGAAVIQADVGVAEGAEIRRLGGETAVGLAGRSAVDLHNGGRQPGPAVVGVAGRVIKRVNGLAVAGFPFEFLRDGDEGGIQLQIVDAVDHFITAAAVHNDDLREVQRSGGNRGDAAVIRGADLFEGGEMGRGDAGVGAGFEVLDPDFGDGARDAGVDDALAVGEPAVGVVPLTECRFRQVPAVPENDAADLSARQVVGTEGFPVARGRDEGQAPVIRGEMRLRSRASVPSRDADGFGDDLLFGVDLREHDAAARPRHLRMIPFDPGEVTAVAAPFGLHVEIRALDPELRPGVPLQVEEGDLVVFAVGGDIRDRLAVRADGRAGAVEAVIRERDGFR